MILVMWCFLDLKGLCGIWCNMLDAAFHKCAKAFMGSDYDIGGSSCYNLEIDWRGGLGISNPHECYTCTRVSLSISGFLVGQSWSLLCIDTLIIQRTRAINICWYRGAGLVVRLWCTSSSLFLAFWTICSILLSPRIRLWISFYSNERCYRF